MNSNGNTKDQLIKKQQMYIRQLELFAEEVSGTKTLKEEKIPEEK